MKKPFYALLMCISMFCAIPCPWKVWDEDARPLMTLFLPLVGLLIGLLWAFAAWAAAWLKLAPLVRGAVLCACPFVLTGSMHMDGFLDVTDALKSRRDLDERRRILKDPNVGSFAVIAGILLVLTQFALFASAKETAPPLTLALIAVVSRTMAAICVTVLRPLSTSEYAGTYRKGIKRAHVVILAAVLVCVTALGFVILRYYAFAAPAVMLGYLFYLRRGFRSLDGMSGDISGYALTFGELCGVAVFALL